MLTTCYSILAKEIKVYAEIHSILVVGARRTTNSTR